MATVAQPNSNLLTDQSIVTEIISLVSNQHQQHISTSSTTNPTSATLNWKSFCRRKESCSSMWWKSEEFANAKFNSTRYDVDLILLDNVPISLFRYSHAVLFITESYTQGALQLKTFISCLRTLPAKHLNVIHQVTPRNASWFEITSNYVYMIVEYVPLTLYDIVRTREETITDEEIENIALGACLGLQHLHKNGILHNDISPDNIGLRSCIYPIQSSNVVLLDLESYIPIPKSSDRVYINTRSKFAFDAHRRHYNSEYVCVNDDYESLGYSLLWLSNNGYLVWEDIEDEQIVAEQKMESITNCTHGVYKVLFDYVDSNNL